MKRRIWTNLLLSALMGTALYAAQPGEKAEALLRHQNAQCQQLIQYATGLHTQKDIPTLVKIRHRFRQALSMMERENLQLRQLPSLASYTDYLLSIDEGIHHMQNLAEEPMNRSCVEEVQALCRFIAMLDQEMIASLPSTALYQASR